MTKRSSAARSGGVRKRALVTGASVGIGAAFAERLAQEQYDVILVARGQKRLAALAERLQHHHGIRAEPVAADLTDATQLHTVEDIAANDATLELLVNNAGFGTFGCFGKLDADKEEAEIRLNVIALARLTRAALPGMIARKQGAIINVSSMAGFQPAPYNATYGATKAYVTSFTEALHEELRGTGVRVQALCPGFTRTEFQERAGIDVSQIPSLAWMTPESVVDASLAALRRGQVVCVPGVGNRVLTAAVGVMPRRLARRLAGTLARPYVE